MLLQAEPRDILVLMNPDSAVADSESEAQAFCSKANRSLPLSGHQSSVLGDHYEIDVHWAPKSETTLKLRRWVSLLRHAYASLTIAQD
jgi:hypothetical protein